MKISNLLDTKYDFSITGITDDSRDVKKGFVFVATKGFHVDHFEFIHKAIENGCVFLVVDKEIDFSFPHKVVENINDYYQELCIKFYQVNLSSFHFFGVTGTDGKTTTSTILSKLIDNCSYIGTNGVTFSDIHLSTNNTTPCVSEFYQDLKMIEDHSISNVSMEVSSEALLHERVSKILFDIVMITNITGDHFNIHKDFEDYKNTKLKILNLLKEDGILLVNGDDDNLSSLKKENLYTIGFSKNCDYYIKEVCYKERKTIITLCYQDKSIIIESPYIGKFNVYNLVFAYVGALLYGVGEDTLIEKIKNLSPISGRCEFLDFQQNFDIVLDYAHTINGIESILNTFKDRRIITVCGCAGGRDSSKRRKIGKLLMDKSSVAIFTMDDPRWEDVNQIIDEMVGEDSNYIRIINRRVAICYALQKAKSGDVVLILGKGRDNYMAIQDRKDNYSDYEVVKDYFLG